VAGEFRRKECATETSIEFFAEAEAKLMLLARTLPPSTASRSMSQLLEGCQAVKKQMLRDLEKGDEDIPF
jgi:hypothetical protein